MTRTGEGMVIAIGGAEQSMKFAGPSDTLRFRGDAHRNVGTARRDESRGDLAGGTGSRGTRDPLRHSGSIADGYPTSAIHLP